MCVECVESYCVLINQYVKHAQHGITLTVNMLRTWPRGRFLETMVALPHTLFFFVFGLCLVGLQISEL